MRALFLGFACLLALLPPAATAQAPRLSERGFFRYVVGKTYLSRFGPDDGSLCTFLADANDVIYRCRSRDGKVDDTRYRANGSRREGGAEVENYSLYERGIVYSTNRPGFKHSFVWMLDPNDTLVFLQSSSPKDYRTELTAADWRDPTNLRLALVAAGDRGYSTFVSDGLVANISRDPTGSLGTPQFGRPPTAAASQIADLVTSPPPVSAAIKQETAVLAATAPGVARGPRVALVLGNGRYTGALGALSNPANDARLVAGALRAAGFDVELVVDADQRAMKQAISRLGNRAAKAGAGATALFYYAGHGIQSKGVNFLVPVGANLTNEADLELDAVAADAVLTQMEMAGSATNIVILDACRNMPLARATRAGTRGLARMDAPGGSFVAYSTAPGQEAIDGTGANSPFATAFAAEVGKAGQPIQTVFQNVRQSVLQATDRKQRPWESSSLEENFYFRP